MKRRGELLTGCSTKLSKAPDVGPMTACSTAKNVEAAGHFSLLARYVSNVAKRSI